MDQEARFKWQVVCWSRVSCTKQWVGARWQPTIAKLSFLMVIKGMMGLSLKAGVVRCIESESCEGAVVRKTLNAYKCVFKFPYCKPWWLVGCI